MLFSCKYQSKAKALRKNIATFNRHNTHTSYLERNKNKNDILEHESYIRSVSLLSANVVFHPPQTKKMIFIEIGGREKCFAAERKKCHNHEITRCKLIHQNKNLVSWILYEIRNCDETRNEDMEYISLYGSIARCSCNELKRKMNKKI